MRISPGDLLLLCIALGTICVGCGWDEATGGKRTVSSNSIALHSEMSDEEILREFKIDISTAESKVTKGKDGYSAHYAAGEQNVHVTRSVVTGLYVFSTGPIKGEWRLGPER